MLQWLEQHGTLLFLGVPLMSYVVQGAVVYALQGRWGMALAMVSYAVANVGLILDSRGI